MSSETRQATLEMRVDDRATAAMEALLSVMKQGNDVSKDTLDRFKSLRMEVVEQNRAFNTLGVQWKANNMDLYAFSRTMTSVGAIGQTLLSTMNSLMLSQIAWTGTSQHLSQAQANVKTAFDEWQALLHTLGPTQDPVIQAHQRYIDALNSQVSVQAQANQQTWQMGVLYAGLALMIPGAIGNVIKVIESASTAAAVLAGDGGLGAIVTSIGAIAGAVVSGVGFAALAGIMDDIHNKGMNASDAIQDISNKIGNIPVVGPIFKPIADGVGLIFKSFYDLGVQVRESLSTLWNDSVATGEKVRSAVVDAFNQLVGDVSGPWDKLVSGWNGVTDALQSGWAGLWNGIMAIGSSIGHAVVDGVKWVVNSVIDVINSFINGYDAIVGQFNSVMGKLGVFLPVIPDIPHLAAGGIVNQPTIALIGERGPEAVVPLSGAGAGSASSGGNTTVYIVVQGSVVTEKQLAEVIDRHLYLTLMRLRS